MASHQRAVIVSLRMSLFIGWPWSKLETRIAPFRIPLFAGLSLGKLAPGVTPSASHTVKGTPIQVNRNQGLRVKLWQIPPLRP